MQTIYPIEECSFTLNRVHSSKSHLFVHKGAYRVGNVTNVPLINMNLQRDFKTYKVYLVYVYIPLQQQHLMFIWLPKSAYIKRVYERTLAGLLLVQMLVLFWSDVKHFPLISQDLICTCVQQLTKIYDCTHSINEDGSSVTCVTKCFTDLISNKHTHHEPLMFTCNRTVHAAWERESSAAARLVSGAIYVDMPFIWLKIIKHIHWPI